MDVKFEQAVRERAYALWLESGMVHGMDRAHWLTAETAMKCVDQGVEVVAKGAALKATAAKSAPPKPASDKPASAKSVSAKAVAAKKASVKPAAPAKLAKAGDKTAAKVMGKSGRSTKTAATSAPLAN